jgi:saccharopine dehydrogenase (NAD+, L-lysine-forming)
MSVVLRHPDGYEFTGIAVVACLKQYLDGLIAHPGLWLMGQTVEPARLFADLKHMGVCVETSLTPAAAWPALVTAGANGLAEKCGTGR